MSDSDLFRAVTVISSSAAGGLEGAADGVEAASICARATPQTDRAAMATAVGAQPRIVDVTICCPPVKIRTCGYVIVFIDTRCASQRDERYPMRSGCLASAARIICVVHL